MGEIKYWFRRKLRKLGWVFKMEREKLLVPNNCFLIDGKIEDERILLERGTRWATENFVFQANKVNMPNEIVSFPFSVNDYTVPNLRLNNFKAKIGLPALSYLIYYFIHLGIKIGREMERNDLRNDTIEYALFREPKKGE